MIETDFNLSNLNYVNGYLKMFIRYIQKTDR